MTTKKLFGCFFNLIGLVIGLILLVLVIFL